MDTFARIIAARLRDQSRQLSHRWLERLNDILTVEPNDIFPTDDLLDHIPQLIEQIADYVEAPAIEELAANSGVVSKARELGLLRHGQRASVHQLLREYHLLGAIVEHFLQEQMRQLDTAPPPDHVLEVASRVSHALRILQQTTIDTFIAEYTDRIATQQARLEGFNKLVSHELRQPLGTLQFSVRLLGSDENLDPERRHRLFEIVEMNVHRLVHLTAQLERVARVQHAGETPAHQEVDVSVLAREVVRQLRDMAEHRGVEVRTAPDLPVVVTDVARLELILMNLISNGIKYSDANKTQRFVEIFVSGASDDGRTICVRDNGIGVPSADIPFIFEAFFRAAPDSHEVKGSGLGLAIVAECVDAIGGRITVGTVEGVGTAFDLWLPASIPPRSDR